MVKQTEYIGAMMGIVGTLKDKSLCNISQNQEVFQKVRAFMEEQTEFLKGQEQEETRLQDSLARVRQLVKIDA